MLALSFLLLIGFTLTVAGLPITHDGHRIHSRLHLLRHGFSILVEMLNLKIQQPAPVEGSRGSPNSIDCLHRIPETDCLFLNRPK